jgi:K+-sensing histidine kinase KdpD
MTRFNEMAAEIEKLVTNLRETEEARKKMLQELAHDLRTPVASMKNLQEIIFSKGDILDREKKGQLQNLAMKEVAYFERLVEDLLFLSGVNDPRYSQGRREVLLTNLVEEEAEFFRAGNIRVECNLQPDLKVKGEELLLRRLLRNALSNAVRYARNEVFVTLTNTQGGVELRVRDDGPGLSANDLETFGDKKFSRDLTHSSGHISVGLGSVIMKKIMHLHDGELTIKNSNPGAEIIFRWPL